MRTRPSKQLAGFVLSSAATLALTGCGLGGSGLTTARLPVTSAGALTLSGSVHGGQQPVSGSAIRMYAVGTNGYGSASVSLLNAGVTITSNGSGGFSLTGKYTCSPEQRVYVTATGGNPGAGTNSALAEMAALGRCGDLSASTFISLNEVTTVASVYALAPFMASATSIGAPTSNTAGLNNAFADVTTLASTSRGAAGGDTLPAGTVIPTAAINTLADIVASCVNSNGAAGTPCATLFAATTVGGVAPTDTLGALLNIAQHPAQNVATLFPLTGGTAAPFQPTLADQPSDFTLAATFSTASLSAPSAVAIDASGNAWITDTSTNKLTKLAHSGAPLFVTSGLATPTSVAIDQAGNAWVANSAANSLLKVSSTGTPAGPFTGGGLNQPRSVAIDGQNNIWIANIGGTTLSEFDASGNALSSTGFATAGTPVAVALNPR